MLIYLESILCEEDKGCCPEAMGECLEYALKNNVFETICAFAQRVIIFTTTSLLHSHVLFI